MSHSDVLALLLPLELGATGQADLALEGRRLDLSADSADRLLLEMYPDSAADIVAWERLLGTTPEADAMRVERMTEVLFRIRSLGRLDRAFYIEIAAILGVTITITELRPLMANWAQAGQVVMANLVRWIWEVTITGGADRYASAGGTAAGEPLSWSRDLIHLQAIFNDLKPAHTFVVFI